MLKWLPKHPIDHKICWLMLLILMYYTTVGSSTTILTTTEEPFPKMVIGIRNSIDLITVSIILLSLQWSYGEDLTMRIKKTTMSTKPVKWLTVFSP